MSTVKQETLQTPLLPLLTMFILGKEDKSMFEGQSGKPPRAAFDSIRMQRAEYMFIKTEGHRREEGRIKRRKGRAENSKKTVINKYL